MSPFRGLLGKQRWLLALGMLLCSASSFGDEPQVVVEPSSFDCPKNWEKVGNSYFTNLLGDTSATLEAANSTKGTVYPMGTIVQLLPGEAMVKREPGFSDETQDWEFFELKIKNGETQIMSRGTTEVRNIVGSCARCHSGAAAFDYVCASDHGCKPLPKFIIRSAHRQVLADPRCPTD